MNYRIGLALLASAALSVGSLSAQMNYQGRLTDANGEAIGGVLATITFSVWDAEAPGAGNKVWGDFQTNADLIDGRFNVVIGPTDSATRDLGQAFAGGARFLEIRVGTDAPLPRQQVLAAPQALNAVTLGSSNRKVSVTKTATLGTSNVGATSGFELGSTPGNGTNSGRDGLLFETTAGTESGGIFVNGDTISMFTAGNRGLLNIYDEDDMDAAGNIPTPKFQILGNGNVSTKGVFTSESTGTSNLAGNLSVAGNITAGTITGTLNTPDITVPGEVGIGITDPVTKLQILGGSDASLTSNGYIVTGSTSGTNLVLDNNEIMARNNGEKSTLYLNLDGGDVQIGDGASDTIIPGDLKVEDTLFANGILNLGSMVNNGLLQVRTNNESPFGIYSEADVFRYGFIDYNFVLAQGSALKIGGGSWGVYSDARVKKDVAPLNGCIEKLSELNPVTFKYTDNAQMFGEGPQIGFIAQEVENVFPQWVSTSEFPSQAENPEDELPSDLKQISISGFEALAVGAIKELKSELDSERAKNAALSARIDAIEAKLAEME